MIVQMKAQLRAIPLLQAGLVLKGGVASFLLTVSDVSWFDKQILAEPAIP